MQKFFKYRPMTIFASIAFGLTLLINLISLNIQLEGYFILYPYILIMVVALLSTIAGYVLIKPKLLRISIGVWLLAMIYNFTIVIFVVPLIVLIIFGTRKMYTCIEREEENYEYNNNLSQNWD